MSANKTTVVAGVPITFTTTWTNVGTTPDNGFTISESATISDGDDPQPSTLAGAVLSCHGSGGVACPQISQHSDKFDWTLSGKLGAFPVGASLTVMHTVTPVVLPVQFCGSEPLALWVFASEDPPGGWLDGPNFLSIQVPPAPCPVADLVASETASSPTVAPGGSVTFTATFRNNGPSDVQYAGLTSSLSFSDSGGAVFSGAVEHIVSCTSDLADPTACPDGIGDSSGQFPGWSGSIGYLPAGGFLIVVYTVTPILRTSGLQCGSGPSLMIDFIDIELSPVITDPDPGNNQAGTNITTPSPQPCPPVDLSVSQSLDTATLTPGHPITVTITISNLSRTAAVDVSLFYYTTLYSSGNESGPYPNSLVGRFLSCKSLSTEACAAFIPGPVDLLESNALPLSIPALAGGATVTIVETISAPRVDRTSCQPPPATWESSFSLTQPQEVLDPNPSNDRTDQFFSIDVACADLDVTEESAPSRVDQGDVVPYTTRISDISPTGAPDVEISDILPAGVGYLDSTCVANSSRSSCGSMTYDSRTRRVSGTAPRIAGSDYLTIVVSGTALNAGNYANRISAEFSGAGIVDPDALTNVAVTALTIVALAVTSTTVTISTAERSTTGSELTSTSAPVVSSTALGTTTTAPAGTATAGTSSVEAQVEPTQVSPSVSTELAATGVDTGRILRLVALLMLGGAVFLVLSRRPRRPLPVHGSPRSGGPRHR